MTDTHFFDSLETRTTAQRESEQFELLVGQLRHAKAKASQYSELLTGIDPEVLDFGVSSLVFIERNVGGLKLNILIT